MPGSRWALNLHPPLLLNSVFLLVCKIFKGSDCLIHLSIPPEPSIEQEPTHACYCQRPLQTSEGKTHKKKSESQGEQDRGTLHHSYLWQQRQMDRMEQEELQGRRWIWAVSCGVTHLSGGTHAGVASVLTPPTSLLFVPSFPQEFCFLTLSTPFYCPRPCWNRNTDSFLHTPESFFRKEL